MSTPKIKNVIFFNVFIAHPFKISYNNNGDKMKNKKDERNLKVMFPKYVPGKTPSPRISIPKSWLDDMGKNNDNREVTATYDPEKKEITIK